MPAQEFYSAKLASLQFSALHIKEICDRPLISPAHPSSRLLLRGSYHCSVKLGAVLLLLVGFFCTTSCGVVRVVSGSHPAAQPGVCEPVF